MAKILYENITNTDDVESVSVSMAHSASMATAVVNCVSHTLDVGDLITIDLGYVNNHSNIFRGYVKRIDRSIPNNLYSISAHDIMTRAVDYFVVSTDPDNKFSRRDIQAEDLVQQVLELSGLSSFNMQTSFFTLAIGVDAEVSLVGAYDYSKSIADIIAYNLWADANGTIIFRNRKPFVMDGTSGQPGDVADVPIAIITDAKILRFNYEKSEKDLRNRIVVWGKTGIFAEASQGTSYDPDDDSYKQILPSGYYKTSAMISELIGTQEIAQNTADYNLNAFNRLRYRTTISVEGDPLYIARNVITLDENLIGLTRDFYIYSSEHTWSNSGYVVNMELFD